MQDLAFERLSGRERSVLSRHIPTIVYGSTARSIAFGRSMSYLAPEFRSDVFVSYSHGVKRDEKSLLKTWSLAFASKLADELRETPGLGEVEVYVDASDRPEQGIDPADHLTPQLRQAVSDAAVLLVLMSPHYLKSQWCTDERRWWFEHQSLVAFPEVGSRILVARIWPVERHEWPSELCDDRGFPPIGICFHNHAGNKHSIRPLGWPDLKGTSEEFRQNLVELSGQIAKRLEKLHNILAAKRQAAEEVARLSSNDAQAIFVHARLRNKQKWEEACHRLIEAGYGVFPNAPESLINDPRDSARSEEEIVRTLAACDGLLLISDDDPKAFNSDVLVIGHQLRNSARAVSRKLLPCAILDAGLAIDDKPRLQQSVRNLNIHWINATASDWTRQLRPWLTAAAVRSGVV